MTEPLRPWSEEYQAERLKDIDASQRATAKMLGVDETTVRRDLGTRAAANAAPETAEPAETLESETPKAANAAPTDPEPTAPVEWFQGDVDPAELAQREVERQRHSEEQKTKQEAAHLCCAVRRYLIEADAA